MCQLFQLEVNKILTISGPLERLQEIMGAKNTNIETVLPCDGRNAKQLSTGVLVPVLGSRGDCKFS